MRVRDVRALDIGALGVMTPKMAALGMAEGAGRAGDAEYSIPASCVWCFCT
jgi:hypothetical protein